jgi:hypothetical protein
VRLPAAPGENDGWRSFRVIGKRIRPANDPVGVTGVARARTAGVIDLDVEPLAQQD